jgi:hypothetical protein
VEHLSGETIERYSLKRIRNGTHIQRAEEHLLVCQECRTRLDEFEAMVRFLRFAVPSPATSSST